MLSNIFAGQTILLTRPTHQALPLSQHIQARGGKVIVFPTLAIDSVHIGTPLWPLSHYDIMIFTSANAVHHSHHVWPPEWPFKKLVIAIGPGTARALQTHAVTADLIPTKYSSEGLLQLKQLHQVQGKSILIFCGENNRPYLTEELQKRGAHRVDVWACYRCLLPTPFPHQISAITAHSLDWIVSTSQHSLQNLVTIFSHHLTWLFQQRLLVINQSMAAWMMQRGFTQRAAVAENASDEAILDCLVRRSFNL
ncbi:MAG: hypothetical protein A3F41_02795 [Coxiella sp. RIFCSPHIGHO2_12_FULL_44_14]|nr:MAG: hypothetical protein A3F41_02795 [Coxiella sp. RIFCSPHIGHO2_12_FULL_44_14]